MALVKDTQKIKIRVFMEVLGWPPENLNNHLKNVLTALKDKLNWKITREDFAEPEKAGERMFSTHVEFEAELNDLQQLFLFAVTNGPSVIEILEPSELYITAGELQDLLADLVSKAQTMDKEIKILAAQNKKMADILEGLEKRGIVKKEPPKGESG